jgi:microcystin-dependent protein
VSTPFIGEIRVIAFGFPPKGWVFCNGQLLPISQNQALFSILGTQYGGDGISNFALPNYQGAIPASAGPTMPQGAIAGEAGHTLSLAEIPSHTHTLSGVAATGTTSNPAGNYLAQTDSTVGNVYGPPGNPAINMAAASVSNAGNSQPHNNLMPYLTVGFIIALQGMFPSKN